MSADDTRCSFCSGIFPNRQMHPLAMEGLGFMTECPDCHGCKEWLRAKSAEIGTEVVVSGDPPIVAGPYTTDPFVCPHGITYWIEPTGEQIAEWVRTRTP